MATIIPITTNTTIASCVQIQNGDIARDSVLGRLAENLHPLRAPASIV
jgi:hypothetical protein